MCGIVGKLAAGGHVELELIERMCAAVAHRGPDCRGAFLDEGIGIGVQRLAVIDLRTGDQPIFNEDRSVVVVLNGEIYNHEELRERLTRRGHRFATGADTEVIVHLYEERGDDCVEDLRGMFAFALWDRRRRRLLAARDRVGKKPLYYAPLADGLRFGSSARAVLEDKAVPRDVDPHAIDAYLHHQYVHPPRSAFAALRRLPPAHVLTWQEGRIATRRYWKLSYAPELSDTPEEELHELLRDRLLKATTLRMRSDVPVGALLSGGVDSSSIVAAMARSGADPIRTFSIGFDVPELDERAHAREVASLYGTDHHEAQLGPEALEVAPELAWHFGEPFADSSAVACFHLAKLAREQVTVALAGDGGDESFAGYERYVQIAGYRREDVPRRYSHLMSYDYFDAARRAALYEPSFAAEVAEPSPDCVIEEPYDGSDAPDRLARILHVDTQTYLPSDLLVKVDVAAMAHSLEVRSPLLDTALMETAAAIPSSRKLDGRAKKRIYRDALRGWLPESILDRPKMGFSIPLAQWFRGPLRELPRDVLFDSRSLGRGLFRQGEVARIVGDHVEGRADNAQRIWALMQLELWFRTYVDASRGREPVALSVA